MQHYIKNTIERKKLYIVNPNLVFMVLYQL